ncbi:S-layer homology domain-containing protein [Paenibacillus rigui]|uniref:SLH domain-containing protein n=1 Tax=Paenibacillus rigui TaxID=554312 RepID=A0A229UHM9_9BACL|nr:S-layer homology domain-containing protein [Paenibacillus rigui]OXM82914.1 hypothetical protein CF651_28290 [Paenibacillus rigui]
MVTIFARILDLSLLAKNTSANFTDVDIDYWAKDGIQQAAAAHLVPGATDAKFEPNNNATRAEAVAIMIRALESDGSIKELIQGL